MGKISKSQIPCLFYANSTSFFFKSYHGLYWLLYYNQHFKAKWVLKAYGGLWLKEFSKHFLSITALVRSPASIARWAFVDIYFMSDAELQSTDMHGHVWTCLSKDYVWRGVWRGNSGTNQMSAVLCQTVFDSGCYGNRPVSVWCLWGGREVSRDF